MTALKPTSSCLAIRIDSFKAHTKNTLIGFADITIESLGLAIKGVSIHQRDGSRWISMPQRNYTDAKGSRYIAIVDFDTKESKRAITESVLEAFDRMEGGRQ